MSSEQRSQRDIFHIAQSAIHGKCAIFICFSFYMLWQTIYIEESTEGYSVRKTLTGFFIFYSIFKLHYFYGICQPHLMRKSNHQGGDFVLICTVEYIWKCTFFVFFLEKKKGFTPRGPPLNPNIVFLITVI